MSQIELRDAAQGLQKVLLLMRMLEVLKCVVVKGLLKIKNNDRQCKCYLKCHYQDSLVTGCGTRTTKSVTANESVGGFGFGHGKRNATSVTAIESVGGTVFCLAKRTSKSKR
uniref:Uncharacterized protein n=1 Tax=Amphimedon queenslandica TaxID=400682 RepID=A0A1X7VNR7_AMPQE